jgi:hypothetical protein
MTDAVYMAVSGIGHITVIFPGFGAGFYIRYVEPVFVDEPA